MRPVHPFPARMAPDTVARWLKAMPAGACVLDPMCGSGVVVRQSALLGHNAKGFDIDPLAVLMSKVWTRKGKHSALLDLASDLIEGAKRLGKVSYLDLPWIEGCPETRAFIEYWFAEPQRSDLARLAWQIGDLRERSDGWMCDALQLALSRIIVTKHAGASLAWDVPHIVYVGPDGTLRSIATHLTDLEPLDEFLRVAGTSAAFRTGDLLALCGLLDRLDGSGDV